VSPGKEQKRPLLAGFCNLAPVSELPNWRIRRPIRQKSLPESAKTPVFGRQRPETRFDRDCRQHVAVKLLPSQVQGEPYWVPFVVCCCPTVP
jgi:hypothetical protein